MSKLALVVGIAVSTAMLVVASQIGAAIAFEDVARESCGARGMSIIDTGKDRWHGLQVDWQCVETERANP